MSSFNGPDISRRAFVRRTGTLAGGALLGGAVAPGASAAESASTPAPNKDLPPAEPGGLPRRMLGRTGVPVTTFTLGTAPPGGYEPKETARLVNVALDLGVNAVDTSEKYGDAQEGVGLAVSKRRDEVFLSTKVFARNIEEAEASLAESRRALKTDHFDLLYFHSLGNTEVEGAMGPEGVFTWLMKKKEQGVCRFLGVSGHNLPKRFPPFLESGEVDVLLVLLNYVDQFTYNFEEVVLPSARKHNVGIVAMKVYGGAKNKEYRNPKAGAHIGDENVEMALRYAMSIPGVATANLGCHNEEQIRQNVEMLKRLKPLTDQEHQKLAAIGRQLAPEWGPHYGDVEEEQTPDIYAAETPKAKRKQK
jgi:hypothetical protein